MDKNDMLMKVASGDPAVGLIANWIRYTKQADFMDKKAYGNVTEQRANEMFDAGVNAQTIANYKAQRNANVPAWWNLIDMYMNHGRYARNDMQQEEWRQRTMEKARNDRAKANKPVPPQVQPVSK